MRIRHGKNNPNQYSSGQLPDNISKGNNSSKGRNDSKIDNGEKYMALDRIGNDRSFTLDFYPHVCPEKTLNNPTVTTVTDIQFNPLL